MMRKADCGRPGEVFLAFLRLGLTAFGGPVAHLGYFREALVVRRRWLDDAAYADLVALCQFLPGPASSQVGLGVGLMRAGLPGALAAWLGFTLPSALALTLLGYGVSALGDGLPPGVLHGLEAAAVAVVAQALWGMGRSLCPDAPRITLAVLAAVLVLMSGAPWMPLLVIAAGGVYGARFLSAGAPDPTGGLRVSVPPSTARAALLILAALLLGLPALAALWPVQPLLLADAFFRTGALVFGGGHVVLPLLQAEVVTPGWVDARAFVAGYGAAQAVPGPLFTFAAYLGAVMNGETRGALGAALCLVAIFLPSFLLVIGVLPFWAGLRKHRLPRQALPGINAAVVGLLLAALYDPVFTSGVRSAGDFALVLAAFALLCVWRVPPWLVVGLSAATGCLLSPVLTH